MLNNLAALITLYRDSTHAYQGACEGKPTVASPGTRRKRTGMKAKNLNERANALADRGVRFFVGKGGLKRRGISEKELNPIFELTDMETMAAMILRTQTTLALY